MTNEKTNFIKLFEELMMRILIGMMGVVVFLSMLDLGWLLIKDIFSAPKLLLEVEELFDIFGMFLLVLIGIELLETFNVYLKHRELRAEVILLVTLIALARKIITIDLKETPGLTLIGIASLTISLSWAYYYIRKIHSEKGSVV